jgi:hypothetical protein
MRLNLILRTAICLEVGLIITFSQSHSIDIGLIAMTSFGVGYAMVTVFVALLQRKKVNAYGSLPLSALALAVGLAAAIVPVSDGLRWFRWLVVAWGLASGAYELYQAKGAGFKTLRGKELSVSAVLGILLGLLYLVLPLHDLDAVGFFGAYMIINAVHLGIAAASERPSRVEV